MPASGRQSGRWPHDRRWMPRGGAQCRVGERARPDAASVSMSGCVEGMTRSGQQSRPLRQEAVQTGSHLPRAWPDGRRHLEKICPLPACGRATSRMKNINKLLKFNKQWAERGQPSGGGSLRREWSGRSAGHQKGEPQGAPRREDKSLSFPSSGTSGARKQASGRARAGGSDRALSAP